MRRFGVQLQRISKEEQANAAPKIQFTIRSLLMVTFCAALLLSVAKVTRYPSGFGAIFLVFLELPIIIIFATVLCMWAALSRASPLLPTVIAIVVVLLMSVVLFWSLGMGMGLDVGIVMVSELFLLSHFGWTLATLLVLRSYGYRVSSRPGGP